MNIIDIKARIKKILDNNDEEVTHIMEDHLNEDFIAYIASLNLLALRNTSDIIKLITIAKELKELTDMNLPRWYS